MFVVADLTTSVAVACHVAKNSNTNLLHAVHHKDSPLTHKLISYVGHEWNRTLFMQWL